jgi:hypothetical protein
MDTIRNRFSVLIANANTIENYLSRIRNAAVDTQSNLSHIISIKSAVQKNTKATSSNSTEYFYYKDEIKNNSINSQENSENYSIEGVCSKRKVNNKDILYFNGTGFRKKTTNDLDGNKIEITYTVNSKMQGELCKNGNIKIILDEENGSASKAIVNGKEIDSSSSYSSESNFCLKK